MCAPSFTHTHVRVFTLAMFYDVIKLYSSFSFILFLKLGCITRAKYSLVTWDGKIMRSPEFKYMYVYQLFDLCLCEMCGRV